MLRQAVAKQRARAARLNLNHAPRFRWRLGQREAIFAHGDHKPCDHPFGMEAPVEQSAGASFSVLATPLVTGRNEESVLLN